MWEFFEGNPNCDVPPVPFVHHHVSEEGFEEESCVHATLMLPLIYCGFGISTLAFNRRKII